MENLHSERNLALFCLFWLPAFARTKVLLCALDDTFRYFRKNLERETSGNDQGCMLSRDGPLGLRLLLGLLLLCWIVARHSFGPPALILATLQLHVARRALKGIGTSRQAPDWPSGAQLTEWRPIVGPEVLRINPALPLIFQNMIVGTY